MNDFISNLKTNIRNNSKKKLMILGNESCDLDSAVSSVVYAYFLQLREETKPEELFIPVLNIHKEELPLKTEVTYLFNKFDIMLKDIICRDDFDIKSLADKSPFELYLVDHHILSETFSCLAPYVTTILDHRPLDKDNWVYDNSVYVKIESVGSCATLVTSEIICHKQGIQFLNENKNIAHLLHSTIVLDTANFLPSADRARPLDFKMAEELERVLKIEDVQNFRSSIFTELVHARTDCSSLNSLQLLNRDLKIINGLPLPGLPMLVGEFLKREDYNSALQTFCQHNNTTTVLIIGLAILNNTVHRDLAIFSIEDCELHNRVISALLEATEPSLGLVKSSQTFDVCELFTQTNIKASRKQIVPIVKKLLNQYYL